MSVFVVITKDRHTDISVEVWVDREAATARARELAKAYCQFTGDYHEEPMEYCEFYARYSCEGDSVKVVKTALQEAKKTGTKL